MPLRTFVEHLMQNVHSNEQITASLEFAGNAMPQFSQLAFISNIVFSCIAFIAGMIA
jgi:hypothetical protein